MSNAQLRELREQQARIATNARAKFDEITDDSTEERAAEIEREFDAMMAEHDQIGQRAARLERLEEAEARANEGDPRRPNGGDGEARGGDAGDARPEYRDVFTKAIRFGAASLNEEERGVLLEGRADVPEEIRAQSSVSDAAGGYTVPTEFQVEIDRALAAWGPMWDPGVTRELNTSNGRELEWPTVDDTGNTGRLKEQNTSVQDNGSDDVAFGQKKLNAYVYDTGLVRVPMELLQDSAFNMESLLADLFGERLGRLANSVLTTGDGSDKPQGIVPATSLGKEAASQTVLDFDEVIDFLHSVDPAYRASPMSRWMFNDATLASLRKLKDGDGNYLWQMGDVRQGEPNRILDFPYSVNQAMPNIASGNRPIIFGDFSRYVVRKVTGFQMLTLRERYAERFQIGVIGFKRFDGELLNSAAVKHLKMDAGG